MKKERTVVRTAQAPAALGPYSQAVLSDGWLFCSGQVALDPASGQLVSGDIRAQTDRALKNLGAVLREAGLEYADVVKTTVFLTDLTKFAEMNEVYAGFFATEPPARSTVQVSALPKGAAIEIEAVARAGR